MAAHQRATSAPDTPAMPPGMPENFAGGPTHIMARLWAEILKVGPRCHAGDLAAHLTRLGEKSVPLRITSQLMALRNAGRVAVDADNFVIVTPAFAHLCGNPPVQAAPAAPAPPPVTAAAPPVTDGIDVLDLRARQNLLDMKLAITPETVAFMRQWLTAQDTGQQVQPVTPAAPAPPPEPAKPVAPPKPTRPDPLDPAQVPPFENEYGVEIDIVHRNMRGPNHVRVVVPSGVNPYKDSMEPMFEVRSAFWDDETKCWTLGSEKARNGSVTRKSVRLCLDDHHIDEQVEDLHRLQQAAPEAKARVRRD